MLAIAVGFHVRIFILGCIYACKLDLIAYGSLARESFFNHVIASFNFIVCGSNLYLASRSSYSVLCFTVARLFLHTYFYLSFWSNLARSLAHSSITQTSTGSSSLSQPSVSSKSLDVATTRTVSYTV